MNCVLPEHEPVTHATLMCMVDKLTRLMGLGSERVLSAPSEDEISSSSMRYGLKDGKWCFYRVNVREDSFLSNIVGEGVIYEEFGNRPRLLCEDLVPKVDKIKLISAAFSFFFPDLVRSWLEPDAMRRAFEKDEGKSSAYCFQCIDDLGYKVLIIFGFENFGEDGQFNLLLKGKFQLVTESLDDIWVHMSKPPPQKVDPNNIADPAATSLQEVGPSELANKKETPPQEVDPNDFAIKTAEFVRNLTKNRAELGLTDVMSHGVEGKPYQTYTTKIPWPQTELTRLIQGIGGVVYDYKKPYFNGVVVCAGLRSVQEATSLIPHAIREISRFINDDDDVKPAYDSSKVDFSELCWKATQSKPPNKKYMYCFELQCQVVWMREYILIMREYEIKDITFDGILDNFKKSKDFQRTQEKKSHSEFCCNIMFQAKKAQREFEKKERLARVLAAEQALSDTKHSIWKSTAPERY